MWNCLERMAAIAGGCVVAAANVQDPGTMVGAAIGAAGLIGYFGEEKASHGPENGAKLARIQQAVVNDLGDPPTWPGADAATIAGWDWSLQDALPQCMLDRAALADSIFDQHGFPSAATAVVRAELARIEPQFAKGDASKFAEHVIQTALSAAFEERTYFESLAPYLWANLGKRVDAIQKTGNETLVVSREISADVKRMLDLLESHGLGEKAEEQGVPRVAVRQIVQRLAEYVDGPQTEDDFLIWLDGWIEAAAVRLRQGSNEGSGFESARMAADDLFRNGKTENASEPFMELLEQEKKKTLERQRAILERAIDMDLLSLQPDHAFDKLVLMASLKGDEGADEQILRAMKFVGQKENESFLRSDPTGQRFAIRAFRWATRRLSAKRNPLGKSAALGDLGTTQFHLGMMTGTSSHFHDAVTSLRTAKVFTNRGTYPLTWSLVVLNLLNVIVELAKRERNFEPVKSMMDEADIAFDIVSEIAEDYLIKEMATIISSANTFLGEATGIDQYFDKAIEALSHSDMMQSTHYAYSIFMLGSLKNDNLVISEAIKIQKKLLDKAGMPDKVHFTVENTRVLILMLIKELSLDVPSRSAEEISELSANLLQYSGELKDLVHGEVNSERRLFARALHAKALAIRALCENDMNAIEANLVEWDTLKAVIDCRHSHTFRLLVETERTRTLASLAELRGDLAGLNEAISLARGLLDQQAIQWGQIEIQRWKITIESMATARRALLDSTDVSISEDEA